MSSSFKLIGVIALILAGAAATMFSGAFAAVHEGGETGASEGARTATETASTSQPFSDTPLGLDSISHTLPLVDVGEPLDRLERFRELEDLIEVPCAPGSDSGVSIFTVPNPCARPGGAMGGGGLSSGSDLSGPDSLADLICGSRGNQPGYGVPGIVTATRSYDSHSWSDDHTTYYRYTEKDSEGTVRVILGWEMNDDGSGRSAAVEYNADGDVVSVSYTEWDSEGNTTFDYQRNDPDGADPDEVLQPIEDRDDRDEDDDGDADASDADASDAGGGIAGGGASQPDPVNPDDEAVLDEWCRQQAETRAEIECRTDPDCESPVDTDCDDPIVNPDPSEAGSDSERDGTTVLDCGESPDGEGGGDTTPDLDPPCPTQDAGPDGPDGPDGPSGTDPRCPGNLGSSSGGGADIQLGDTALIDEMCALIDCGQSWADLDFSSTLQSEGLNAPVESLK